MIKISLSELRSGAGKYVDVAAKGEPVYITKHGRPLAKIVDVKGDIMQLIGIVPSTVDLDSAREERLNK